MISYAVLHGNRLSGTTGNRQTEPIVVIEHAAVNQYIRSAYEFNGGIANTVDGRIVMDEGESAQHQIADPAGRLQQTGTSGDFDRSGAHVGAGGRPDSDVAALDHVESSGLRQGSSKNLLKRDIVDEDHLAPCDDRLQRGPSAGRGRITPAIGPGQGEGAIT